MPIRLRVLLRVARRAPVRAGIALALALGGLVAVAWAAAGDTSLASRASGAAGAKGGAASSAPDISGDGRSIAFESVAANLHPDDGDGTRDVFVRHVPEQAVPPGATTTLVSRAGGPGGAKGDGGSSAAAISANGVAVAFESVATNLDVADGDAIADVFVRDLVEGTTTLASRATGAAGAKGDGASRTPAISGDGRFVAFSSAATNLDPDDDDTITDVFVRDLVSGTTTLVSRATGPTGLKGNAPSSAPVISDDGRFVAYSSASNLDPADLDELFDVYVRDLQAATTTLASRATGAAGAKGNGPSVARDISGDGRYVVFDSGAFNLGGDTDEAPDVFVRDLQASTTTLASRATGAEGPSAAGFAQSGAISADGRWVTFSSAATNLDPADGDATADVFVRDLQANTTTLASRATGAAGAKGNGASGTPAISGDGGFVAFESVASNLNPDDLDATTDVFVREAPGAAAPPPGGPAPGVPPGPPAPVPTPAGPAQAPVPVVGRSELVEPVSGTVRVRRRGTRRFVRLRAGRLLPDGSEIDTRRGVVRVVVAAARGTTATASALVSEGRAVIDQNTAARPTTTLELSQPLACPRGSRAQASKKRKRPRRRKIFTDTDGGAFRTRGDYAAATASGTAWRTTDMCTRTRIDVRQGTVSVRDLVRRRTVVVKAPRSYTATRRAARPGGGARPRRG